FEPGQLCCWNSIKEDRATGSGGLLFLFPLHPPENSHELGIGLSAPFNQGRVRPRDPLDAAPGENREAVAVEGKANFERTLSSQPSDKSPVGLQGERFGIGSADASFPAGVPGRKKGGVSFLCGFGDSFQALFLQGRLVPPIWTETLEDEAGILR